MYQALDNLQQLLHHHGDALVTKETADGLEVRWADKVPVRAVYVGVGNVQGLGGGREEKEERKKEKSFII
jgi:hypothetical protein